MGLGNDSGPEEEGRSGPPEQYRPTPQQKPNQLPPFSMVAERRIADPSKQPPIIRIKLIESDQTSKN